jgi:hypothetical protein
VDLSGAAWRTSSYSGGNGGQCVAVAAVSGRDTGQDDGLCLVRDSKNPDGPVLTFGHQSWSDFAADVKAGRFDLI